MRLTEKDLELFRLIAASEIGRPFYRLIERIANELADARQTSRPLTTPEGQAELTARLEASKVLEEYLLKNLRLSGPKDGEEPEKKNDVYR